MEGTVDHGGARGHHGLHSKRAGAPRKQSKDVRCLRFFNGPLRLLC